MGNSVNRLTIRGYKSIRELVNFDLGQLSVLIGANGAGKSNFISFFSLLRALVDQSLQLEVQRRGGAAAHLFLGPKVTKKLTAKFEFARNAYEIELERTTSDGFVFAAENARYHPDPNSTGTTRSLGKGHLEANLRDRKDDPGVYPGSKRGVASYVFEAVSNWVVYHFHDTSESAPVRSYVPVRNNEWLARDAGNIAAFLMRMRDQDAARYRMIRDTIRMVAPFFDEFHLREHKRTGDPETLLEWRQKGAQEPFGPAQLSDGTLRFMCLVAALMQPAPPATVLIDEPELGLHPYALGILGSLIKQAARRTQVIVSTQSAALLDHFSPEDVIVVDRQEAASTFKRLDAGSLKDWLESYSLGDLWQKNVLSGGPSHE